MKQKRELELMMATLPMLISIMASFAVASSVTSESLMGGHLDNQATTHEDDAKSSLRYRIANVVPFAFNGGQPFSLEKDPVTGQIDFDKAPPLKALNYTGSYEANNDDEQHDVDDSQQIGNKESENDHENNNNNNNDDDDDHRNTAERDTLDLLASLNDDTTDDDDQQIPNEINPYSPSFHDFLNLPVRYSNHEKYTSDKYPLISNSYANTKVQGGSNTYNVNTINHKNYHHGGEASTSQSYSMTRRPFIPRTTTTRKPIITTTMKPFIKRITTTRKPIMTTTTRKTTTTSAPTTTTRATTTTTTPKPTTSTTTTTTTTTTTAKLMMTTPVTTWKPDKNDRYDDEYSGALLPIEKIQNSDGSEYQADQIFGISDMNGYDDNYEDYVPLEFTPSASTSTTTTTSPPTTTTSASTTTTTTTPTPTTTAMTSSSSSASLPITSMPLDPIPNNPNDDNRINRPMQGPVNINVGYNDYLNHPINHPSYSGLVVESASNVIVPPDQDTISFVLGNRQNVDGSYYAQGSAIPESPYGDMSPAIQNSETGHPDVSVNLHPRPHLHQYSHEHPQHPLIHENIPPIEHDIGQKWWFNSEQSDKSQSVIDKTKDDKINVVAGYRVVFPTSAPESSTMIEDVTSTISPTTPPPSSSRIPIMNDGLSQLSEILTPPAIDGVATRPSSLPAQRPLHYPPHHHYHQTRPEMPTRIQRPPLLPNGNGYKIRPIHVDINLPNILPQFRPNVKTSQRRGSEAIGTMIVPSSPKYPPRVSMRPPPIPPAPPSQHRLPQRRPTVSHLQRLNPPPPPPPVHALRLPSPAALIGSPDNRKTTENVQLQNEIPPLRRNVIGIEGQLDERNRLPLANNQILKSRLNDEDADKISSESLGIPPRAPLFPKRRIGNSSVATLQMIQQHRVQSDTVTDDKLVISGDDADGDGDGIENENRDEANRRIDEPPVYVVYPVKGSIDIRPNIDDSIEKEPIDESVVIGIHGPQRPLPPETLSQQNDDDNSDTDVNIAPVRVPVRLSSDFPYPPAIPNPSLFISQLQEKPLLVPNQHHHRTQEISYDDKNSPMVNQQDKDTSINIIPYLQDHQPFPLKQNVISTTLQLFGGGSQSSSSSSPSPSGSTVTPIAYVYTPTTRAPQRRPIDPFERNPVLLPSQQPSSSSSSAPSPQNFMAPFVASISAEAPSKNGWSVVTGGPFLSKPNESSDKIDKDDNIDDAENNEQRNDFHDRIDTFDHNNNASIQGNTDRNSNNNSENNNDNEEKTEPGESSGIQINGESFDVDNFKPQLFGGFQPIFEFPSDSDESPSERKTTDTMAMMEKPRVARDSGA